MRLIDADKLPELETIEAIDGKEVYTVYTVSWIPKRAIDAAPTVEAIPIEWINNWVREHTQLDYFSMRFVIW